jgi:hypothetical protein
VLVRLDDIQFIGSATPAIERPGEEVSAGRTSGPTHGDSAACQWSAQATLSSYGGCYLIRSKTLKIGM